MFTPPGEPPPPLAVRLVVVTSIKLPLAGALLNVILAPTSVYAERNTVAPL